MFKTFREYSYLIYQPVRDLSVSYDNMLGICWLYCNLDKKKFIKNITVPQFKTRFHTKEKSTKIVCMVVCVFIRPNHKTF